MSVASMPRTFSLLLLRRCSRKGPYSKNILGTVLNQLTSDMQNRPTCSDWSAAAVTWRTPVQMPSRSSMEEGSYLPGHWASWSGVVQLKRAFLLLARILRLLSCLGFIQIPHAGLLAVFATRYQTGGRFALRFRNWPI